jgi:4-amino-4-deoxy-L-arabinose transferase-like glycosyltransferase
LFDLREGKRMSVCLLKEPKFWACYNFIILYDSGGLYPMLFTLSLLIYASVAIVLSAVIFHKISFSNFTLIFYLTIICENILTAIVLHFFQQLSNAGFFVAVQIFISVVIVAVILLVFKPSKVWFSLEHYSFKEKGFAFSVFLLVMIVVFFGIIFWVGIKTPPNNLDSLHTHLNRIYYWLQHGNLANWPATSDFQLTYPINANLQGLWIFLLTKNENLFFLVAWFSLIVTCVSIFKIGRLLNLSTNRALIGSLVFLAAPAAVLQAYSFQNDLAVTALISITLWGILVFQQEKQFRFMLISALALALALGVKQTAFMVVPAIALLLIYYAIKHRNFGVIARYTLILISSFLIFSSFKYFQNIVAFGSFFGTNDLVSGQKFDITDLVQKARYNIPRYTYDSISFDGLPKKLQTTLDAKKANVFMGISSMFGIDLEDEIYLAPGYNANERFSYTNQRSLVEDTAWFGPLVVLMILISLFVVLFQKDKTRKTFLLFAFLYYFIYASAILLQRPGWDPYQGRYFILGLFPFFPLVGVCIPNKKIFREIFAGTFISIWVFLSFYILCMNDTKPIITTGSVTHWQNIYVLKLPKNTQCQVFKSKVMFKLSVILNDISSERQMIFDGDYYEQLFYAQSEDLESIALVNKLIPKGQAIYLKTPRDPLEYALFGVDRTRMLFPVVSVESVPENGYLIVGANFTGDMTGFSLLEKSDQIMIYQRIE